jgi:hypothetical protein
MIFDEEKLNESAKRLANALRAGGEPVTEDSFHAAMNNIINGIEKEKNKIFFSEEYLEVLSTHYSDIENIVRTIATLNEAVKDFAVCPTAMIRELAVNSLLSCISDIATELSALAYNARKELHNVDPANENSTAL